MLWPEAHEAWNVELGQIRHDWQRAESKGIKEVLAKGGYGGHFCESLYQTLDQWHEAKEGICARPRFLGHCMVAKDTDFYLGTFGGPGKILDQGWSIF